MRSRPGRSTDGPCRSKYLERVPFSIQGHTMELYGPREVMIPHSRTILSWSRRCHTFNSRRSLLKNRKQLVFVLSQISVPCFFSFCRPLPPQIAISGLWRLPIHSDDLINMSRCTTLTFWGLGSFAHRYQSPRYTSANPPCAAANAPSRNTCPVKSCTIDAVVGRLGLVVISSVESDRSIISLLWKLGDWTWCSICRLNMGRVSKVLSRG